MPLAPQLGPVGPPGKRSRDNEILARPEPMATLPRNRTPPLQTRLSQIPRHLMDMLSVVDYDSSRPLLAGLEPRLHSLDLVVNALVLVHARAQSHTGGHADHAQTIVQRLVSLSNCGHNVVPLPRDVC